MGRTRFSGPVYGAKTILASAQSIAALALSQTNTKYFEIKVPANEDWLITNVNAYCEVAGAAAATVDVRKNGATIASVLTAAITLVATTDVAGTAKKDAREDEGTVIVSGDKLEVVYSSGATTAPGTITVTVVGYRRFRPTGDISPTF